MADLKVRPRLGLLGGAILSISSTIFNTVTAPPGSRLVNFLYTATVCTVMVMLGFLVLHALQRPESRRHLPARGRADLPSG